MVGHGVVAEGLQILLGIEDVIHHPLHAAGHQHGRPGDLLGLAVGLATQQLLHQVAGHLVVVVEVVKTAGEGVGETQGANEVTHRDLAVAQLRLQGAIPVHLEGMEEDLAVGRFNHEVLIFAIHGLLHGNGLRVLIRTHAQGINPGVLGGGRVLQEGQGHANSASVAVDRRSVPRSPLPPPWPGLTVRNVRHSVRVAFTSPGARGPVRWRRCWSSRARQLGVCRARGSRCRRRPCWRAPPRCSCAGARSGRRS